MKDELTKLSSVLQSLKRKKEIDLMWELIRKYPEQLADYNIAYA